MTNRKPAVLALENGDIYHGFAFGDTTIETSGEVVFNTAMAGYQEVITDPSYKGQIVVFTYPLIGNYGINEEDGESSNIHIEGIIVKEYSKSYSNWRAVQSLEDYLLANKKIGIEGIDTRKLVRSVRSAGTLRGVISTQCSDIEKLITKALQLPSMQGQSLSKEVARTSIEQHSPKGEVLFKVALLDFGLKNAILENLLLRNCEVHIVPGSVTFEELSKLPIDGIFLSNGPGDPSAMTTEILLIQKIIESMNIPIYGICLGHQLLGLAFGATTYKLKYGHRGVNHPIKNLINQTIEITSQNHGFAVNSETLPSYVITTHINLNDGTLAGLKHTTKQIASVQYHPESSPGPHDSWYFFDQFLEELQKNKENS